MREGEGLLVADLDLSLIVKRKRMLDSVGHYARPELLNLVVDDRPKPVVTRLSQSPPSASEARSHADDDACEPRTADQRVAVVRRAAG
jgi:aliphatic nitrilase